MKRRGPLARAGDALTAYPNLTRFISVAVFLLVWESLGPRIDPLFLTYPSAIVEAFRDMWRAGEVQSRVLESMVPFAVGMAISIVLGIFIGFLMGQFEAVEYLTDPFVNALNAIPRVALVPLIMLWFGLGVVAKIVIIVSVAVFPVIINTYAGVRDVRGSLLEVGRAHAATDMQIFTKIVLPAAVPFIMAGIRLAVGLGIIGMIVAEFFTAIAGLGGMIVQYGNNFQTARMFVPIIIVGVLGIVLTQLVGALERRLAYWRRSERERQ